MHIIKVPLVNLNCKQTEYAPTPPTPTSTPINFSSVVRKPPGDINNAQLSFPLLKLQNCSQLPGEINFFLNVQGLPFIFLSSLRPPYLSINCDRHPTLEKQEVRDLGVIPCPPRSTPTINRSNCLCNEPNSSRQRHRRSLSFGCGPLQILKLQLS